MMQQRRRLLIQVACDSNLLGEMHIGFVNSSTGNIEHNASYPLTSYYDFVRLKAGATYKLTCRFRYTPADVNDGTLRIRVYDINQRFLGGITDFNGNNQYSLRVKSDNRYLSDSFTITPISDRYVRIMVIAKSAYNAYNVRLEEVR